MYKCLNCKAISYKPLQPLINNFSNTYRLFNNNNERFLLLLRKSVYPYEYMIGKCLMKQKYHQKIS